MGAAEAVLVRNGRLMWEGSDAGNVHEIYSATKTFTSTVMGLMVTEGAISVDDLAAKYLPSIDDKYPEYGKVRLRDLATMSAGYTGALGGGWSYYADDHDLQKHLEAVEAYTIPGKPLFEPRTAWQYHDPQPHMLGYILTKVGGKSLEEMIRERVAKPIGMKEFSWSNLGERDGMFFNNPAGTPGINGKGEWQGGVYTNARDLARYGLLYLNKGNWNGKRILDASYVEQATTNQVPVDLPGSGAGHYGFYWWTNGVTADGTRPWPDAPPKTYTARGGGRNYVFVIPEWNMVFVRISTAPGGYSPKGSIPEGVLETFFTHLKKAVVK